MKKLGMNLLQPVLVYLYNISIRRKIMYSYTLFIFLMVGILTFSIYHVTSDKLYKQNSYSLQQGFNQTQAYLAYKLDTLISTSNIVISNYSLNSILNEDSKYYSPVELAQAAKTMRLFMKSIQESDEIRRASIYVDDSWEYIMDQVNIMSLSKARESQWWDSLFLKRGVRLFVGSDYLEDEKNYSKNTISMFRAMYSINDYSKVAFVLRLDMRRDNIENILYSSDLTSDSITFLMDENDHIVASSGTESYLADDALHSFRKYPENNIRCIDLDGGRYMFLKGNINGTNWDMITLVPYSSFMLSIQQLLVIMLVIAVVILLLAFVLSRIIAYTITRRIFRLCSHMEHSRNGTLTEIKDHGNQDEIGTLYKHYNRMILQIHKLLQENYLMGQELKNAEYMALQSQINPHFLYNTLDMINWFSHQKKSEEIRTTVFALTSFYKLSLSKGKTIITISDELRHVEYYMKIQSLRFAKNIMFRIDVDGSLLQYSIPKITLQPIVENALFHGILEKEKPEGIILITASLKEGILCLAVSDNGTGMPPEVLSRILDAGVSGGGSHYGLFNIHSRLKLQYGEGFGLTVVSELGQGTSVQIRIPAVYIFDTFISSNMNQV